MNRIMKLAAGGAVGLAALAFCTDRGFAQTVVGASGVGTGSASSSSSALALSSSLAGSASINGGNDQIINYNTPATQTIKNVPNVYAPGLAAAGSEVCLGSASAGGAAAGFGLTLGGTIVDRECQLRLNARTLATLGYVAAARETMCLDADVRQAMAAAGTPCAADRVARRKGKRAAADTPQEAAVAPTTQVAVWPFGASTAK